MIGMFNKVERQKEILPHKRGVSSTIYILNQLLESAMTSSGQMVKSDSSDHRALPKCILMRIAVQYSCQILNSVIL